MAVPRNRLSNAKKNSRRSHHAEKPNNLATCKNCKKSCLPHHVCPSCGFYANRPVYETESESE